MAYKSFDEMCEELEINTKEEKKSKIKTKKNKKGLVISIAAIAAALGVVFAGVYHHFFKKNKVKETKPKDSIVDLVDDVDLNTDLEFDEKENTIKVTGNIDPAKVVTEGTKTYDNKEAAEKAKKAGFTNKSGAQSKTVTDTKNDTLIVKNDGTVETKTKGNEVKDDKGNIISQGEGTIPQGYTKDEKTGKIIKNEDISKAIYADSNYYDKDGNLIIEKGMPIDNTIQNYIRQGLLVKTKASNAQSTTSSTQPSTKTETKKENTSSTQSSTTGKYTINGLTFESKADYEQWVIQGYEGYSEYYGIMMSDEAIQEQVAKLNR